MHRYDFHEQAEPTHFYDEDVEEDFDLGELEENVLKGSQKGDTSRARRSVDEYLEQKRLRERYKDLFDDYFGENS